MAGNATKQRVKRAGIKAKGVSTKAPKAVKKPQALRMKLAKG